MRYVTRAGRAAASAVGNRLLAVALLAVMLLTAVVDLLSTPLLRERGEVEVDHFDYVTVVASLLVLAFWTSRPASFGSPLLVPARFVVPRWLDRAVTRMQGTRPSTPGSFSAGGAPTQPPAPGEPTTLQRWLRWALPTTLLATSLFVSLLPIFAILRGAWVVLTSGHARSFGAWVGLALAFVALLMGSIFFAYSVKYYLSTAVISAAGLLGLRRDRIRTHGGVSMNRIGGSQRAAEELKLDLGYAPFISVHIAAYNESGVIERLLRACAAFDYPNYEVILVDDSTEPASLAILDQWRGRPNFKILHRTTRDGFKGGALTLALSQVDPRTEFVAIFDADAVPFPDTLNRLLPHFYERGVDGSPRKRSELAAVQSYQWHVLNKSEGWLTEAVRTEYSGSYMIERPFQEVLGSLKMIAGTAYMIRVERLRELGWGRSITEDWEMTLRLYARGYKVAYTPFAETPAECVSTFHRLTRQRMRWAEGHSFNVRRYFGAIMRSSRVSPIEKLEFAFYTTYYLQAVFLGIGTVAWLLSQFVFRAQIPEWGEVLGYSLIFTNGLALPLMNLAGLMLEEAPRRDFNGVMGAITLSFLLVPYQGWAAVKGFLEKEEGTWNRTPKTGRVTDPVQHLRKLHQVRRWMLGRWSGNRSVNPEKGYVSSRARPRGRLALILFGVLAWVVIAILGLTVAGLAFAAQAAPVAGTTPTQLFLGTGSGTNGQQVLSPQAGRTPAQLPFVPGGTATWASQIAYGNGATSSGTYNVNLAYTGSTCGPGKGANACAVTVSIGYYSGCNTTALTCSSQQTLFSFPSATLSSSGSGVLSATASQPSFTLSGCPCALYVAITSTSRKGSVWTLVYGSSGSSVSVPPMSVPERLLDFAAVAALVPLLLRARRRKALHA